MKRCPKSPEEPRGLRTFRKENPIGSWEEFRHWNEGKDYDDTRTALFRDQGGLCAFCEIQPRRENRQIAHFHPKSDRSGDRNWALDWSNLWLACKGGTQSWMYGNPEEFLPPLPENRSCDEAKTDQILDDEILAPHEIPAFPRIFRYEQQPDEIRIAPDAENCHAAGVPPEKVQRTIKVFNLNCSRLCQARLAFLRGMEQQVKRLREVGASPETFRLLVFRFLRKSDGIWPKFFTLSRWRLRKISEDFLSSIDYEG